MTNKQLREAAEAANRDYVVMKRGYYYRPNAAGYTAVLSEAGRYTLEEAKAHANHEPPRVTYKKYSDAAALTQRATVETQLDVAQRQIATLTAERDAMREALKPFALLAEHDCSDYEDDDDRYIQGANCLFHLTVGDLRRAAKAKHLSIISSAKRTKTNDPQ